MGIVGGDSGLAEPVAVYNEPTGQMMPVQPHLPEADRIRLAELGHAVTRATRVTVRTPFAAADY
jgi:hypothetical protein